MDQPILTADLLPYLRPTDLEHSIIDVQVQT